jgi:hypothetical protein
VKARRVKGLDPHGSLADNLERILTVRLDELSGFVPAALDPAKAATLHDLRIAAKRLRYILEVAEPCFGPYVVKAGARMRELQDLLGEIHDCDVTRPRVLALAEDLQAAAALDLQARADGSGDLDPALVAGAPYAAAWRGLTTLAVFLAARRALLFERFLELWRDLERQGFRARLAYAITERPEAAAPATP